MRTDSGVWDLLILDADPPVRDYQGLSSLSVGDLDGDGEKEIVTGGDGALLWYRPATSERGVIARGKFGVGLALEDIDGDGTLEVVAGVAGQDETPAQIRWYKHASDLHEPWQQHVLDPECAALAHDLLFVDLDGDGERELLANAAYAAWGLYAYKRTDDISMPWVKSCLQEGYAQEGLAAADLDGDGRVEIVSGPDWYAVPPPTTQGALWERHTYAPSFREMSRVAVADITRNGRPDIVIAESEYVDGRLSWFENRMGETPSRPWQEHHLADGLVFAHSLGVRYERDADATVIFVAEMASGGWDQPPNHDARVMTYMTTDGGQTWYRRVLAQGSGTHQAVMCDIDGDGIAEVVGKQWKHPQVNLLRHQAARSPWHSLRHRFLDRDKPYAATDILPVDIDGDGREDVVCGAWWYENPLWTRRRIPGISQVLNAYDLDGDGRPELIAIKEEPGDQPGALSATLCWLKPVDPVSEEWLECPIGTGHGDWPHGTLVAPILADGGLALVAAYHGVNQGNPFYPEIFAVPGDPRTEPWSKRVLAPIRYGEQLAVGDLDGNGRLDLVAGPCWLERVQGAWRVHQFAESSEIAPSGEGRGQEFTVSRVQVADINGNGRLDVVIGEQNLDFENRVTPLSRLVWYENPGDPRQCPWPVHVIDKVRCPHSVDVADLDGDGVPEIICGEHDPFSPYRSRCRLLVYKRADPEGMTWYRHVVDGRFEHHCGAKSIRLGPGRLGIISHGWKDSRYVHLWEQRT